MRLVLLFTFGLYFFNPGFVAAQSIRLAYEQKNYPELVKYADKEKDLSGEELYMVGFGFFQSGDDTKAILFYDKAISREYDKPFVHFYKALSYRYMDKTAEALASFDKAIAGDSLNQEYACEKAFTYYHIKDYDKAIQLYENAKKLPDTYQASWYMIPHISFIREKDDEALQGFYSALDHFSKNNEYYFKTLMDIGQIQYVLKKNFEKALEAYALVISMDATRYEVYPKLMKVYNAAAKYSSADSVFASFKKLYDAGMVDEETKKYKTTAIAEYKWKEQLIVVYKNLEAPKKTLDIIYKAYLLDKEGKKVERTFLTEQTIQFGNDSPKHLLCENWKSGGHSTYPVGWKDDNIPLDQFIKEVRDILDEKNKPAASSTFGTKGN